MVTRHWGALLGIVSLIGLGSLSVACGGDDDDNGGTAGTSAAGAAGSGTAGTGDAGTGGSDTTDKCTTAETCESFKTADGVGKPPAKPADAPVSGEALVQGIDQLFIGDVDRSGAKVAGAWKDYGFDIDGWSSTPEFGFHCKPQTGGKAKTIRQDGNNGIDNAFGAIIVTSVLESVLPDGSAKVTESITGGSFSVLLKMEGLGTATTGTGVKTQLFAAAGTKGADGKAVAPGADWSTYEWHPYTDLLEADGVTSKVIFPDAYVTNSTWVSGGQGTVNLQLALAGQTLALTINKAQLDVTLSADQKTGTNGNIGGILETEQLITSLKGIAGSISTSLCGDSPTFDGIAKQIRGASDIMKDGSQDPAQECNGISIGIGFTSRATKIGASVKGDTATDPCAGAAGSGG